MRYVELPWRGAHPRLRTIAAALLLVGIGVALASPGTWTGEVVVLLTGLALVLARRPGVRQPRSEWRPWRRPNPVRTTLAIVFGVTAGATLVAKPLFEPLGDVGSAAANLVFIGLLAGSAVVQTGPYGWFEWLNRLAWGCLTGWSAWQLYLVLAR